MDTSMSIETIVVVVVLAFATYYGARWILIARARHNRRKAATLNAAEIDLLVDRRDKAFAAWDYGREILLPRSLAVLAGIMFTVVLALALDILMSHPNAPRAHGGFIVGWVIVALAIAACALAFVVFILRPFFMLIRLTRLDQMITAEMRTASRARRSVASRESSRRGFRRAAR